MKAQTFPLVVKRRSATVKIYKTPFRGVDRFTISYWADGVRRRQVFADLATAKTEAAAAATRMTEGDLDVLTLTSADRAAYLRARQLLDPLGFSLEMVAAQYADVVVRLWRDQGERAALAQPEPTLPPPLARTPGRDAAGTVATVGAGADGLRL